MSTIGRSTMILNLLLVAAVSGAAPAEPPVFEETDGLVAVEVESHPPADQWQAETEMEGFTGGGYYTWRGGNLYRQPGRARSRTESASSSRAGTSCASGTGTTCPTHRTQTTAG